MAAACNYRWDWFKINFVIVLTATATSWQGQDELVSSASFLTASASVVDSHKQHLKQEGADTVVSTATMTPTIPLPTANLDEESSKEKVQAPAASTVTKPITVSAPTSSLGPSVIITPVSSAPTPVPVHPPPKPQAAKQVITVHPPPSPVVLPSNPASRPVVVGPTTAPTAAKVMTSSVGQSGGVVKGRGSIVVGQVAGRTAVEAVSTAASMGRPVGLSGLSQQQHLQQSKQALGKKNLAGIVISSGPGGQFDTYEGTAECLGGDFLGEEEAVVTSESGGGGSGRRTVLLEQRQQSDPDGQSQAGSKKPIEQQHEFTPPLSRPARKKPSRSLLRPRSCAPAPPVPSSYSEPAATTTSTSCSQLSCALPEPPNNLLTTSTTTIPPAVHEEVVETLEPPLTNDYYPLSFQDGGQELLLQDFPDTTTLDSLHVDSVSLVAQLNQFETCDDQSRSAAPTDRPATGRLWGCIAILHR